MAGCASEVWNAEEIPAYSEIHSKIRPDLPVVFQEPVKFVLVVLADFSSRSIRLARMVIRGLVVEELRVGGFPGLKPLRHRRDRSGEEGQHVLRQRNVVRQHAGNLIDTGDGDITDRAGG